MKVFRLAKGQYVQDLSGKGAEIAGGRWNSKGVAMVYTSQSRALCLLEIAVHIPVGIIPSDYFMVELEIPEEAEIKEITEELLPSDWNSFPHSQLTQSIGDKFVRDNESLVLKVPSAIVKGDYNFLINPAHTLKNRISILGMESFNFDNRLFT